jgi:hypothetical protein
LRGYQTPVLTSTVVDDLTVSAPQLGKSFTGQCWLLAAAYMNGEDPRPWWWAAPTYQQARHGYLGLVNMARSAGLLASATVSVPFELKLTTGGIIQGRSWERPGGLYGTTILGCVVDEFGQMTHEAYSALSSRRGETISQGLGRFRYLGNTGAVGGPAEALWNLAEDGHDGFRCRRWTWRDRAICHPCTCELPVELSSANLHAEHCPRGIYVRFIAREADRMSAPQFRMLYEAEWADWNDLPVYQFDRSVHVDATILKPAGVIDLACDFNVDPMAWIIGCSHGDQLLACDELTMPGGATTQEAVREFIRRYPDRRATVRVFGDASGTARRTSASRTDYQIILDALRQHYLNVEHHVPKANPPVADRVNAVNAALQSSTGAVRYRIHPRCVGLINDFARVSWKPGTRDIDKSNRQLTHFSDAEGYRINYLRPIKPKTGMRVAVGTGRHESVAQVAF